MEDAGFSSTQALEEEYRQVDAGDLGSSFDESSIIVISDSSQDAESPRPESPRPPSPKRRPPIFGSGHFANLTAAATAERQAAAAIGNLERGMKTPKNIHFGSF